MKDFITILAKLKPVQPCIGNTGKLVKTPKHAFVDFNTESRIPPLTARGLQNIHFQETFTLDVNSLNELASGAKHSLNQAIKNNELVLFLKNKHIPIEERVRKLRESLSSIIKTRHSIKPFITAENSNLYEDGLNGAILDENGIGYNAAFEFGLGGKNDSDSFFIGTMAHELEHRILGENFGFIPGVNKDSITMHEFICDLAAFDVLNQVSCGDKKLFEESVNEYISSINRSGNEAHYVNNHQKCGFADEAHEAARGTLNYLIEQCRKQNIDLAEVIKQLHDSSIEQIGYYKTNNKLQSISYSDFIKDLTLRISEPLKAKGFHVDLEECKEPTKENILRYLESYFGIDTNVINEKTEATITHYMQTLIPVPKIKITKS